MADSKVKIIFGCLAAAVLLIFFRVSDWQGFMRRILDWIENLGAAGIFAFVLVYVSACVLFIPGSLLTLGAGALFGVVKGSVIVSISSTLGAALAFLIGRYLARGWVSKKVEGNSRFKAIDEAVAAGGWKIVGLARLSPVFPFNLLNYAFGLTRVSFRDYLFASWIGMMPGTILYVYVGSLAGSLANLNAPGRSRTRTEWIIFAVGLAATVSVAVYATRIAKKALEKKVG